MQAKLPPIGATWLSVVFRSPAACQLFAVTSLADDILVCWVILGPKHRVDGGLSMRTGTLESLRQAIYHFRFRLF